MHVYDKAVGNAPREMIHGENVPMDIKVWDPSRQPISSTPCDNNNAGCSHLCLLSPSPPGYMCACPTGIRLINNHTCADGKSFVRLSDVKKYLIVNLFHSPFFQTFKTFCS